MNFFRNLFSSKPQVKTKSVLLYEERSPTCPLVASVEQIEDTIFFFLQHLEDKEKVFPFRGVWVRNLKAAPPKFNKRWLRQGRLPLLNAAQCKFPEGQALLNQEDLRVVWNKSGDGAALLEQDEILAIIPTWSENMGSIGYARDCIGESAFCWELPLESDIIDQVWEAEAYWEDWEQEFDPFFKAQPVLLDTYTEMFGDSTAYYALDGEEWPPKGLYLLEGPQKVIFATVGVSLLAMPTVGRYYEDYELRSYIELGLLLNAPLPENIIGDLASEISGITGVPWDWITFLDDGHTINSSALKSYGFSGFVFMKGGNGLPEVPLSDHQETGAQLLWLVPLYPGELRELKKKDRQPMLEAIRNLGVERTSLDRADLSKG